MLTLFTALDMKRGSAVLVKDMSRSADWASEQSYQSDSH